MVTGNNSSWTNGQALSVGDEGHGTLTVSAGGRVSNAGICRHRFRLDRSGQRYRRRVQLDQQRRVICRLRWHGYAYHQFGHDVASTNGLVGSNPLGFGTVTVAGARSNWLNSGSLSIGFFGEGSLTVEAGARVSNTSGTIGQVAGSTGTVIVRDTGSRWSNGNFLRVGDEGEGRYEFSAVALLRMATDASLLDPARWVR